MGYLISVYLDDLDLLNTALKNLSDQGLRSLAKGGATRDRARRRFEFQDGKSSKFWEIEVSEGGFTTCWGKIGAAGQSKTQSFGSAEETRKQSDKLIAEKTKKGYIETEPAAGGGQSSGTKLGGALQGDWHRRLELRNEYRNEFCEITVGCENEGKDWYLKKVTGEIGRKSGPPLTVYISSEESAKAQFQREIALKEKKGYVALQHIGASTPVDEREDEDRCESLTVHNLKRLLNGEEPDIPADEAGEFIYGLQALCQTTCARVGELDHFRYDEDDFPELWQFQFGEGSSSKLKMPSSEGGIPCAVHWFHGDLAALLQAVEEMDLADRPEYVNSSILIGEGQWSTPVNELKRWLSTAMEKKKGLFCFYS